MPQAMPAVIKPAAGNSKAAPTDVKIINESIMILAVIPRQLRFLIQKAVFRVRFASRFNVYLIFLDLY